MPSVRWHQVEALYHATLEREGPERDRFLEEQCAGDAAMRQELESLLQHGAASHAFVDAPAMELTASGAGSETLEIGSRLGSYEITALLGEGGMGRVYRARDCRLGRDVAVKILDDPFSGRFEREARAV